MRVIGLLLLFVTVNSFAQNMKKTDYTGWWKKIDALINTEGRLKTALAEVKSLQATAVKEGVAGEEVKAMLYRLQIEATVEEGSDTTAIGRLREAVTKSEGIRKALYQSLLADYLKNYYDNHRWQLYDRGTVAGGTKSDITTWSTADFNREISAAYQASLSNKALLQATPAKAIGAMVTNGNAGNTRPTAFDLVAWHALDYFKEAPAETVRSINRFRLSDPALLAPAPVFMQASLNHADSNHQQLIALQVYQELLRFHTRSKNEAALIAADLDRLAFVKDQAIIPHKIQTYRQALETLAKTHPGNADDSRITLAQSLVNDDPSNLAAALQLANALRNSSNPRVKADAHNLTEQIKKPALTLTTEKVNLPEAPFRALVNYANLSTAFFRLYPMTETLRGSLRRGRQLFSEKAWAQISGSKLMKEWQQPLPLPADYREHSTEVKIDGLPIGEYILLAGSDASFAPEKTYMAAVVVRVSNISYINRDRDYFILDRNTGQPLSKASIQTWKEKYDRASQDNILVKGERFIANESGYVHLALATDDNVLLDVNYHNDRLFTDDMVYHYRYRPGQQEQSERKRSNTWFFLDRSIYRPGQLVYFKGIAISSDSSGKSKPYSGQQTTVQLFNANNEAIDSITLKTNAYGSIQGSFRLPEGGLTGSFSLRQKEWNGTAYFRVEEYKRPKFQVALLPVKGSYRVHDTIVVEGTAKAYAGNAISNAGITYRVTRNSRIPFYRHRIWPPYREGSEELINGTAVTGADGRFAIRFTAVPDPSIEKSADPVFDYQIQIDVTDLNGETRSASQYLSVSYKALHVTIGELAAQLPVDSLKTVTVSTRNAGGLFEPAQLKLQLFSLQSPGRLIRARYWQQPDQFAIAENDFRQYFPYDEYKSETDVNSWALNQEVFSSSFLSTAEGQVPLAWKQRSGGWYRIVVTGLDRFGDSIRTEKNIYLIDPKSAAAPSPGFLVTYSSKTSAQPGEKLEWLVGTATEAWLISQRENHDSKAKANDLPFAKRFDINKVKPGFRTIGYTVQENDRGGMGWTHVYVQHNRVYVANDHVAVPWNNKQLSLAVSSFRDKTEPGSPETWTVTVKGPQGEQAAAELLTSMYDASLDQFTPHGWSVPGIWPHYASGNTWNGSNNFEQEAGEGTEPELKYTPVPPLLYDALLGLNIGYGEMLRGAAGGIMYSRREARGTMVMESAMAPAPDDAGLMNARNAAPKMQMDKFTPAKMVKDEEMAATDPAPAGNAPIATRTDFRETAFFFPQLSADAAGNYQFSFTMPEALTSWKWQLLAHTKDLAFGTLTQTVITQKELMVQTNMPRFLREGDKMEISTKIVNLGDKEMTGQAELQLIDPANDQPVDGWFRNFFPNQYFTVAAGGSEAVKFPVEVPYLYNKALTWRIIARSENYSDGESASLPVLTNRELVTETKPFFLNGNGSKDLVLQHLVSSGNSETLSNQSLTVEFSSNPAWYAVQALPYLADYPYACAEQTFNRLYATLLAAHIVNKMPAIKQVLESWKGKDTAALISNLQKNAELKQILLEETPWVLNAKNETEQEQKIAALFNLVQLSANTSKIAAQLKEMQTESGGFSWFKGGRDDRYITQYILTGIGRLKLMGALPAGLKEIPAIVAAAIPYLDNAIRQDYALWEKTPKTAAALNEYAAQYLYMRSYFPETGIAGGTVKAADFYRKQCQQQWIKGSRLVRGMIATMLFRTGDKVTAAKVLQSLAETAVQSEELGMYWKDNSPAYYWQQAPVETQALMIEAFQTIKPGGKEVAALKTWLLKNKQASHWPSTKATADACYALLLQGGNWLEAAPNVSVQLGGITTVTARGAEAGTGYYQQTIPGTGVHPEMGRIKVQVTNAAAAGKQPPVWGAVYWQYFEQMDKIEAAASPLSLNKEVFVERLTDNGPTLQKYTDDMLLKVGDKLKIRITLKADRAMEYIHVKDLRASNLEPVNVLSGYQWQGGLGYYQAPRDASMNFFISYLPQGTYVFEYALFVNQAGTFSNGIAKAQSMYAPEFSSHSEAMQLRVE
ncbi:MAG: alpha-2-macroglobulin family protein [Flavihumibacter sp.]